MHPLATLPLSLAMAFVARLLWDGWRNGEVWVGGGSGNRLTPELDMHTFAHKLSREDKPFVYWVNMPLLFAFEGMGLYVLLSS